MKSILVPLSGSDTDSGVIEAAYALASRLKAHLDFAHIPLSAVDLRIAEPHIDFARGESLQLALKDLSARSKAGEARVFSSVEEFCKSRGILQSSKPSRSDSISAGWIKPCEDMEGLLRAARAHELIVVGRSSFGNALSLNLLDTLIAECGRPILLVPPKIRHVAFDTVAVWWKDHAVAARAASVAMPVIAAARRVAVLTAEENGGGYAATAAELAAQMAWHGVEASHRVLLDDGGPVIDSLWDASAAEKADLVVMGAYSHSRMREFIFGGCTEAVIESGPLPVLLLH
jgi:nucleotide-binding universal stress UspA family protein